MTLTTKENKPVNSTSNYSCKKVTLFTFINMIAYYGLLVLTLRALATIYTIKLRKWLQGSNIFTVFLTDICPVMIKTLGKVYLHERDNKVQGFDFSQQEHQVFVLLLAQENSTFDWSVFVLMPKA